MTVDLIELGAFDLVLASLFIVLLSFLSLFFRLGLEKKIIYYSLRMTAQLIFIGLILRVLFERANGILVVVISIIMLLLAGNEVRARQGRKIKGFAGYFIGTFSICLSSFFLTLFALLYVIKVEPWYTPQYAIPLLGMMFGNTMSGIAISLDRLNSLFYEQREIIEQRLMLGQNWQEAILDIKKVAMRAGMIPVINSMAAAGVVSLPGMMTGQILGGSSPMDAVKYQILIMLLICAGTGFGVIAAIWLAGRHLFDKRQRICMDRLY